MDNWIDGRSEYVVWKKDLSEEEVRKRYFEMTGREPDRIHSPEESVKKSILNIKKRRKENE